MGTRRLLDGVVVSDRGVSCTEMDSNSSLSGGGYVRDRMAMIIIVENITYEVWTVYQQKKENYSNRNSFINFSLSLARLIQLAFNRSH